MLLSEKLTSIKTNIVDELGNLLDKATLRATWSGRTVISVEGYVGTEKIDRITEKYFKSSPFLKDPEPTLKQRLDCYGLGGRIRKLYEDSDVVLQKTWFVKYFASVRNFFNYLFFDSNCPCCSKDLRVKIEMQKQQTSLFDFKEEEFRRLWPNRAPEFMGTRWQASKEMVEEAYNRP